jgi:hypothetical protein
VPEKSVAIVDCKQMKSCRVHHVGNQNVTILVHLVRVSRLIATRSGKGKLSNCVKSVTSLCRVNVDLNFVFFLFLSISWIVWPLRIVSFFSFSWWSRFPLFLFLFFRLSFVWSPC